MDPYEWWNVSNFRVVLLQGLFAMEGNPDLGEADLDRWPLDKLLVYDEDANPQPVLGKLRPLVGSGPVVVSIHHRPPTPPDPRKWGGGCCLWEGYGWCPAGHHEDAGMLYNLAGQGEIVEVDEGLGLRVGEEMRRLGLRKLVGHRGRILIAPVPDPSKLGTLDPSNLAGLQEDLGSLIDVLRTMQDSDET